MQSIVDMTALARYLFLCLCLIDLQLVLSHSQKNKQGDRNYIDPSREASLIRHLLARYRAHGKYVRPLKHTVNEQNGDIQKITVKYGLRLMQLELNERKQVMQISTWIRMLWYDEYLTWNATQYHGIEHITLPHDLIWTPDITLMNTADSLIKARLPAVQVRNNGSVFWTPHAEFTSACQLDVTHYPFDEHTCDMWFQSIAHRRTALDLQPYTTSLHNTSIDGSTYLDGFSSTRAWDMLDNKTELFEQSTDGGMILLYTGRPALRFRFKLKRRPGFKAYILILPCVLLSLLTIVIFCLPPERPDRNTIGMSLFTSCLLMLLLLSSEAPPTAASTPKICLYYVFNMVAIMTSFFCSALVIYVNKRAANNSAFPSRLAKILRGMEAIFSHEPTKRECGQTTFDNNLDRDELTETENWRMLARVLDRFFCLIFIVIAVVAFVWFFPWVGIVDEVSAYK